MMTEVALVLFSTLSAARSCESLKSLSLPGTTITAAELVSAGPYTVPSPTAPGAPAPPPAIMLPAHCRVAAVLEPASDSHIEMEVWLPAENWNGKLEVVGNGGWAGTISFAAMASALREGYATASTDTGHRPASAAAALDSTCRGRLQAEVSRSSPEDPFVTNHSSFVR